MGRNRRPKVIHDAAGTFEKHPEREAAFAKEPKPDGPLGPPPAEWRPHPFTEKAEALFAEGKDAYAVAAALGITWEIAKSLRPTGIRSEAQELLAIWYEVTSQAPPGVLTRSDRLHVELTCRLIRTIRSGKGKSGDYSRVKEYLGKMAMNPADRPKVQVGGGVAPSTDNGKQEVNTFEQLAQEDRDQARIN